MENSQMRSRVLSPVDRISDLPDSVICSILSFLPTKLAVATSILGRRWKFLWTKVPVLDFDDDRVDERTNFVQFINKVFIQRDAGHLEKFLLSWSPVERCDAGYVNVWVGYAIARKVRVLNLWLHNPSSYRSDDLVIQVPSTLFTCVALEYLRLNGDIIVNVPSVVCLPKLKVLILELFGFGWNESLVQLISACPVLDYLRILRCESATMPSFKISSPSLRQLEMETSADLDYERYHGKVEIDAPNLKFLCVQDYITEGFSVKWLPSVDTVDLDLYVDDTCGTDHCNSFVKLIEDLSRVKFLTLNGTVMKALSKATIPLSACFERLTTLDIHCQCCEWSYLNLILDYSIRLQVLNLTTMRAPDEDTHNECWKDPKQVPKCFLSSLTHVSFAGFMGFEEQMAMMRYILKHGMVLKSVIVESGDYDIYGDTKDDSGLDSKFEMLQRIAMLPRCSPVCEIKFN